jgi:penicillin amidase
MQSHAGEESAGGRAFDMKLVWRGLGLLVAVLAVALVAGFLWLRTSLPQVDGTIRLAGLEREIEILRDRHGVPHIFAATEEDAYFALGFVHAQDRLWQMEAMRMAGAGRLAEVVGERGLRSDRFVRTLGLYRLAEESYARLPPAMKSGLDAYARGVNAMIESNPASLPPEFVALRHRPEAWRPADSLVWGRLMALRLADNWQTEALRARLAASKRLTPKQIEDLWPDEESWRQTAALPAPEIGRLVAALIDAVPPELGPVMASNIWAVSGERSASGKPMLANDPHLGFQAPEMWYLARIEAPGLSLAGATAPGVPFVLLGHNDRIAWGFTTTHGDTQDLFVERLDPGDAHRYLTPDGPRPFAVRTERILVRDAAPVELVVRETRHGPVVTALDPAFDTAAAAQHVLAFATPGLRAEDRTAEALWRVNRARDRAGFEAALTVFEAPQQNVGYADVDGNFGIVTAGLVPVRKSGDGTYPAEGWTGEMDWTGFIPYASLPRSFNPRAGRLVNANNKPGDSSYPHFLGRYWDPPYRAERAAALLDARATHTPESMAAIQMDVVSLDARDLLPLMLKIAPENPRARRAVELLSRWDGTMDGARPEPLIYTAWQRTLLRVLGQDEIGPQMFQMWGLRPDLLRLVLTREQAWCDNITTPKPESCADALTTALDEALASVAYAMDEEDIERWRWDKLHRARFRHTLFGFVPVLRDLADIVVPMGGGAYTLNRAAAAANFEAVHGAGMRAIYDLANLDASRFVVATGQSGNLLSRHYDDMTPLWREGKGVTIAGTRDALRDAGAASLILAPARTP